MIPARSATVPHGIEDPSFVRNDKTLALTYISCTASDRLEIVLANPPFGGRDEDGIKSNCRQHFRTREAPDRFLALNIRLLKQVAARPWSCPTARSLARESRSGSRRRRWRNATSTPSCVIKSRDDIVAV